MRSAKLPLVIGAVLSAGGLGCNDDSATYGKNTQLQTVGDAGEPASCSPDELGDTPPVATAAGHSIWPPNHKFHYFSVADCATAVDACGDAIAGEFMWGSSDEPVNDIGDGNHEPDIIFDDCERVGVRSERQGPKDGRVYKLGVRFTDAAGNATDTECTIIVDHDQRGVEAADSGESYRIALDGSGGTPVCDGVTVPPPGDGDGDGDGDEPGDGDGDGDAPGDGDGDGDAPGDGDGDGDAPGDGDGDGDAPGDGDGDGDGDAPGDGDGDGDGPIEPPI